MARQRETPGRDMLQGEVMSDAQISKEGGGAKMAEPQKIIAGMPDLDEDGFLQDGKAWTKEVAEILAQGEVPGELTEDHWIIIHYMREYYLTFGSVPPVRALARRTGISLRQIKELFPNGLTKGACRIAGIPRITIRPSFLYP